MGITGTRRALDRTFYQAREVALGEVRRTPGYLSEREARFLFLVSALAPARGAVLEIGSFKGRSTVALASGVKWNGEGVVYAVDPHTSPSPTDPDLKDSLTSWDEFVTNIEKAGVASVVTPYRELSQNVAPRFCERLRVLWIDGDHTTEGARRDLRLFRTFLEPGAIVAMHDVLGTWEGSLRVFCEDVLASNEFAAAGFCGSIGWAQYAPQHGHLLRHRIRRRLLAFPARQLLPVAASGRGLVGLNKLRYKVWRPLAPHGEIDPWQWVREVTHPG